MQKITQTPPLFVSAAVCHKCGCPYDETRFPSGCPCNKENQNPNIRWNYSPVMLTLVLLLSLSPGAAASPEAKVADLLSRTMNSLPSLIVAVTQLYYAYLLYRRAFLRVPLYTLYFSIVTILSVSVPALTVCYIHLFGFCALIFYFYDQRPVVRRDNTDFLSRVAMAHDDEAPIVRGDASGPDAQTVDQGSVHTAISHERGVSSNSFAASKNDRSFMCDKEVTQSSYYDQWIYLPPFTLDSSTSSSAYSVWSIPSDLFDIEAAHNPALIIFNSFAFVSWDELEVIATVSSPPQVSGFAVLTVFPSTLQESLLTNAGSTPGLLGNSRDSLSPFRLMNMPHCKLSYTESNPMSFTFPWNFPYSSVSTTSNFQNPVNCCRVAVANISSPKAGVNQDTRVTITLAIRFKNLRGEGKRPLNVPTTGVANYANRNLRAQAQDGETRISLTVAENARYSTLLNAGLSPTFSYKSHGPAENLTWTCRMDVGPKSHWIVQSEICPSKKIAKTMCIRKYLNDHFIYEDKTFGIANAQDGELEWDYSDLAESQDLTSILGTVGKVAGAVSNVAGTVAEMSNPVGLASAAGSLVTKGLSSLLGFAADAPWKPTGVEGRLLPLNHDHLAGGTGPRGVVVMDINDSEYETVAQGLPYNGDEGYNALFREGFVDRLAIPVDSKPGVLAHLACSVIDGFYLRGVSDSSPGHFYPTPAGYVASCYTFVSGAKEYVFYVVKASQQRVTLNFAFNPTFPPRVFDRALAGRSETVTFQEDVTKVFEAPIIVANRVHEHNPPQHVFQYFGTPVESSSYLTVSLVNPIVTNSLCADTSDPYVFSRMKKGSMFFSPRTSPLVIAGADGVYNAQPIPESEVSLEVEEVANAQDGEGEVEAERAPMIGTSAAAAAVSTMSTPKELDGFGAMPKPLDVARRAVRVYSITGTTPDSVTSQQVVIISVNYLANRTLEPTSKNFQFLRPNMFNVLSSSNAFAHGSLDYLLDLEYNDNTVKNVSAYYVNSLPKYLTRNSATAPYDWDNDVNPMVRIVNLTPSAAQTSSVNDLLDDLVGSRALEIRQIGLNSQIFLGLPCHTRFSCMSTVPVRDGRGVVAKRQYLPCTAAGYVVLVLPRTAVEKAGRVWNLNIYRRAADSCHFGLPIGPPLARFHKGSGTTYAPIYSLNVNELPSLVAGKLPDLNLALQYHSRLFGGITGLSEYPVAEKEEGKSLSGSGATNRSLLIQAGDVESNPGPVMSKPEPAPRASTCQLVQDGNTHLTGFSIRNRLGALKRTVGSVVDAAGNVPTLVNNLTEATHSLPQMQNRVNTTLDDLSAAANSVKETTDGIKNLTSTFDDMIKLVYDKLLSFTSIPWADFLQIAHYISIMMMSNERAVSISCFVGIIARLGLISSDSIITLMTKITSFFSTAESQDSDDAMRGVRYFNIIFSVILSSISVAFTPVKKLPTQLLNISTALFCNLNQVDVFLKHNFDLISEGLCWFTSTKYKAELYGVNLGEIKPRVESWLTESVSLLDPTVNQALRSNKKLQKRLISCYKEGADIYETVCKLKLNAPNNRDIQSAYNLVDKQFKRLADKYVEYAGSMLLSDKYSVPFCVWLYGSPGIGKTHLIPYLALQVAKELNLTSTGDVLYRRETGQEYWDALAEQPFLWMSDPEQDNSETGITQFIKDWFGILSPTEFIPNMAALQDKGRKHKFTGVFVDSNSFCASKRKLVLSDEAFQSRRDVVAHVIMNPAFIEHCAKLNIPAGRNLINSYCAHVRAHPEHAFPGFKENDHLKVSFTMDGTQIPPSDPAYHIPFSQFVAEVVPKIAEMVKQRRVTSAAKERMFDELSPEATVDRLKTLDSGKRKEALDLLTSLLGENDEVEEVRRRIEELPTAEAEAETVEEGEPATPEPAQAQDETSSVPSLSNWNDFLSADDPTDAAEAEAEAEPPAMPMEPPYECIHEFVTYCEYPLMITGSTLVVNWPRQMFRDDNRFDLFLKNSPEIGGQLTRVVCPPCNCSWTSKNIAFDSVKEKFVEEDHGDLKALLKVTNPFSISVTPSTVLNTILKVLGMVALGYAATRLIGWIVRKFVKPKPQDYERVTKVPTTVKSTGFKLSKPAFSQDSEQSLISGCGLINFFFKTESGVLKAKTTNAYAIGGTVWFVAGHTIRTLRDLDVQTVEFKYKTAVGTPVCQVVPWKECKTTFCVNTEYDYGAIEHPRLAPVRKKTAFFATSKECKNASTDLAVFDYNNGNTKIVTVKFQKISVVQVQDADGLIRDLEVFVYHGFEGASKCGSPLVDMRSGKIVGFHVLGWPGKAGGATPITLDNMDDLIKAVRPTFVDSHQVETKAVDHALKNESCIVEEILDASMVGRVTVKSKLVNSAVHGALGPPEKIIPTGTAQDALIAMEPYSKPPKTLVVSDVEEATNDYLSLVLEKAPPVSTSPPTIQPLVQVLKGNPQLPFHPPPMRDTSSGVPLIHQGLPRKGDCFTLSIAPDGTKTVTSLHPKFVALYNSTVSDISAGIYPKNGHMLFLKDERKKPAKAIRGINGCDFVMYCLYLQYFQPFFAAFRKARFEVGSAIGMDISRESAQMFSYLAEAEEDVPTKDAQFITADYKNFGPTIIHHVASQILVIIKAWYRKYGDVSEEQFLFMDRLFACLLQSNHIVLKLFVRPQQGIFSGNPFTAEINTMVNNLYLRLAWLYCIKHADPVLRSSPWYWYRKYVRCVCYGDDLVARTHRSLYTLFNNVTIKAFMDVLGLTFTDALKRAEMVPLDPFEKVSFLKHSFSLHPKRPGLYLAALDYQTIVDMVCYVRGKSDVLLKSVTVCEDAVRFAHGHGTSVFDSVCTKLAAALSQAGHQVVYPSWDSVDAFIFECENPLVRSLVGSSSECDLEDVESAFSAGQF